MALGRLIWWCWSLPCGFTFARKSFTFKLAAFLNMQTIRVGDSPLVSSRLAYGCWRLAGTSKPAEFTLAHEAAGRRAVITAYEAGYSLFDNADIYGGGLAEQILGRVLREVSGMRAQVLIATKCGVRHAGSPRSDSPERYDFAPEYIVDSCEQSLKRLGIETIDLYMLHRPDYLADPHAIAGAFAQLHSAGKVRFFGVSNFRTTLLSALQAACPMPLIAHQVEISLGRLTAFDDGTLDQCLEKQITPQAWSPLAGGLLGDGAKRLLPAQKGYQTEATVMALDEIAKAHGVSRTGIALAWLLRHPSRIMPIVGSNDPDRIRDAANAPEVELTREEWYQLMLAARGEPLP
jgi:predicted oxidoreductase